MPQVRFEHTTQVFNRTKTVHALDRAANVTDKEINEHIEHSSLLGDLTETSTTQEYNSKKKFIQMLG
jgi:hypothetical protein